MKKIFPALAVVAVFGITSAPAFTPADESDGAGALTGCSSFWTQNRKTAVENVAKDRLMCVAGMMGQPLETILKKCGASLSGDDLKNFTDFILGVKEGAAALGANIPDAPRLGTYLPPGDAGR
jgi:hypothetical protein